MKLSRKKIEFLFENNWRKFVMSNEQEIRLGGKWLKETVQDPPEQREGH